MSESEKDGVVQGPNDQTEADEISTSELDAVAGGVLALQQLESGGDSSVDQLSSANSNICCN